MRPNCALKIPTKLRKLLIFWLRGLDLNQRPLGYEALTCCIKKTSHGVAGSQKERIGVERRAYRGAKVGLAFGGSTSSGLKERRYCDRRFWREDC